VYFVVRPDAGQLRELASLIDSQRLRPVVSLVFGLSELPEAFRAQRGTRPPGKVVVSVGRLAQPGGGPHERRPATTGADGEQ
jgi:hypothetical protein